MNKYILLSPAKINLYLKIVGKREDGYHIIESLIQKISLFDIIYIKISPKESLKDIKFNIPIDPYDNTVLKTINIFKKKTGIKFGYQISVLKNIPTEAGLGGGSSNAGILLKFLNSYFKTNYSINQLIKIAMEIGADVPLFTHNSSLLHISGIGEKLKNSTTFSNPYKWYVLIKPNISLSTKKVYQGLKLVLTKFNKSIMEDSLLLLGSNDLEDVAFKIAPELKEIKSILNNYSNFTLMTGSGSVIYAGFKTKHHLEKNLRNIKKLFPNYKVFVCRNL